MPPSINQFSDALDKNGATALFRLLNKYRPETKKAKAERLRKVAADAASGAGSGVSGRPPARLQFGLNHVVNLIEQKKAKLVCIASDVDPIELRRLLCRLSANMGVPYCIVKNRSRLGTLVNQKNATCVAVTEVNKEDAAELDTLVKLCTSKYNDAPAPKWATASLASRPSRPWRSAQKCFARSRRRRTGGRLRHSLPEQHTPCEPAEQRCRLALEHASSGSDHFTCPGGGWLEMEMGWEMRPYSWLRDSHICFFFSPQIFHARSIAMSYRFRARHM